MGEAALWGAAGASALDVDVDVELEQTEIWRWF